MISRRLDADIEINLPFLDTLHSSKWRREFSKYWDHDREHVELFDRFDEEIIQIFEQYLVPLIVLGPQTPKEAVCQVFEKVNTGGVPLTVFELLTATFAIDGFNLRDDWFSRSTRFRRDAILSRIESTEFLQAVTLLATRQRRLNAIDDDAQPDRAPAISCKRKDVLRLSLEEYQTWADIVTEAFIQIPRVLHSQKIFSHRDVPYWTQLIPLAAIIAVLGPSAQTDGVRRQLTRWYWCGVFGELYGSAVETRFAKDLPEVVSWIGGGSEPENSLDASFVPSRLLSLRTRNSAAYKGLYALLMKDGGLDFRTGESIDIQMYADERIDIHHLFMKEWCRRNGIDQKLCQSIINKTPLSARTNRMIGGAAPSEYLERIQRAAGSSRERMDSILQTHVVDPVAFRADDFSAFFSSRQAALLQRIERAMDKTIVLEFEDLEDVEPLEELEEIA